MFLTDSHFSDLSYNDLELPQFTCQANLTSLLYLDVRGNRLLSSALSEMLSRAPRASVYVDEGTSCCIIETEWEERADDFEDGMLLCLL
jgi:hypothetical protein